MYLPPQDRIEASAMCSEYIELASNIDSILSGLTELTRAQLQVSRVQNEEASKRLALEIEREMAELECANSALLQHVAEHKCQGANVP